MKKKEWAESQLQTLVTLLKHMQEELNYRDRSGEYSPEHLRGFSECSWKVMDYIELMQKDSK